MGLDWVTMFFLISKRQSDSSLAQLSPAATPTILTAPQATFATTYNFSIIPTPSGTVELEPDQGLDGPGTSGAEKAIIISCIVGAGLVIAFLVMYMTLKRRRQIEYAEKMVNERTGYGQGRQSEDPAYHYHSSATDRDDYYLESALSSPQVESRYLHTRCHSITIHPQTGHVQNLPSYTPSQSPRPVETYQPTSSKTGPHMRPPQVFGKTTFPPEYKDKNGGPPYQQPFSSHRKRYTVDSVTAASVDSMAIHGHKPHYTTYADLLTKNNPYSPSVHTRGRANSIASSKFDDNAKAVRQSSYAPTIPPRRNSCTSPSELAMALPPMTEMMFTAAERPKNSPKGTKTMFLFPQPLNPTKKASNSTLNLHTSIAELSAVSSPTTTHASTSRSVVSPALTNASMLSPSVTQVKNQNINDAYRDSTLWRSEERENENGERQDRISSMLSRRSQEILGRGGIGATFETVDWQSIDWNAKIGSGHLSNRPRSSIYSELGRKEEDNWEAHRQKVIAALQSRYWADKSIVSESGRESPATQKSMVSLQPTRIQRARGTFGPVEISSDVLGIEKKSEGGMVASITEVNAEDRF